MRNVCRRPSHKSFCCKSLWLIVSEKKIVIVSANQNQELPMALCFFRIKMKWDPAEKMIKIINVNDGRRADLPRMQHDANWLGELTVVCINQSSDGAGIFLEEIFWVLFMCLQFPQLTHHIIRSCRYSNLLNTKHSCQTAYNCPSGVRSFQEENSLFFYQWP